MRKFIILCLMAAIGAVAMIQRADAGQNADFCRDHSNWPGCENSQLANPQHPQPQPQPQPPGGWQRPPHGNWHRPLPPQYGAGNYGFYFGLDTGEPPPPPGYGRYYYPGQCRDLVYVLRDQGFVNVRPLRCAGPRLVYSAWRDGRKLILYVSRDGRIRRILPAY